MMSVNFHINELSAYARSCDSWKLEKEILGIKHKTRKMVEGSKTTPNTLAVQRNKIPYNNYERIVKKNNSAGTGRLGKLY